MSQSYEKWDAVPAHVEASIRRLWLGSGTATSAIEKDRNGREVTAYRLANCSVRQNVDYLTDQQKMALFNLAANGDLNLGLLLDRLAFETEAVTVGPDWLEIYYVPTIVVGTWPHCNSFGGMDGDGSIHC
jgi:hypothetical protein